jgi:hypothetical protein
LTKSAERTGITKYIGITKRQRTMRDPDGEIQSIIWETQIGMAAETVLVELVSL